MDFIFGLSIICTTLFGLLGIFLTFTEKGNKIANRILGIFFMLWALDFLDGSLMLKGFYFEHPDWALWTESFLFLYGPLVYFYTLFTIDRKKKFHFSNLFHLIPFLFGLSILLVIYHSKPVNFKVEILKGIMTLNQPKESFIGFLLVYAHFFLYIFLAYKKLICAMMNFEAYYSYPRLQWLQKLLYALSALLALSIVSSILQFHGAVTSFNISLIVILLSIGLLVGRLIFKALDQQSPILLKDLDKKYSGSNLPNDEAGAIQSMILKVLSEDELYLEPELTLVQLSEKISFGKQKVSQVINERMGKNFFDLINTYRINRAKQIFKENKDAKLTVLEVMYDVGFNSKSSFNTQFKKRTGLTPSEFLRLNS